MSDKQEKIKKLLEMQKNFIEYEHEHGVQPQEYYSAPENHPLHNYREDYWNIADEVVNMAHAEKGSKRD